MKKLLSILLAVTMLMSMSTFAASQGEQTEIGYRIAPLIEQLKAMTAAEVEAAANKFPDMRTHWSRTSVGKIMKMEIIAGYPDGRFGPEDALKVEHFIRMTVCAMGFKVEPGVKYWAQPYIDIAKQYSIIGANEFTDYAKPITRQEAARLIVKAALLKENAPDPNFCSYIANKIKDYHTITDAYKNDVLSSYALGLLAGTPEGNYNPKGTLTRGQGSSIILRYIAPEERSYVKVPADEMIELTNIDGGTSIAYAPSKKEIITTACVIKNNLDKTKGYADPLVYNQYVRGMGTRMYSSYESRRKNCYEFDFAFSIEMIEYYANRPYYITIYNPQNTQELHKDFFIEVFKYWFGKEYTTAIQYFDKYADLAIKGIPELYDETLTIGGRKVNFCKGLNSGRFTIWVNTK